MATLQGQWLHAYALGELARSQLEKPEGGFDGHKEGGLPRGRGLERLDPDRKAHFLKGQKSLERQGHSALSGKSSPWSPVSSMNEPEPGRHQPQ